MAWSWGSLSLCSIIILVLDVIAIVEIAGSSRNTVDKLIWILFIVFAPFLGLVCYYIFADRS
ncbi:MAG: PLDc_N domain-containing protein [Rhodothermaceae bacterium]|nr:PLDc_N domain-containing protein [Rhodothermaceae bacterium]MXZ57267.1 PLDc_N domain-containing protein [Rhodothermaceae bacterium]MYB91619.1 PLDc_N domain-containing protein [Rhodothermaceae bacterium]MYD68054.1 PLDc_N domain-containing protein [Rhodothermaceae bacterium]MYG44636.1 PLDc_N domain-containing protein [Rhodothermaceae bacterium]